jgi:hypothetical protein
VIVIGVEEGDMEAEKVKLVSGKRVTRLLVVFIGSCSGRVSQPD